MHVTFASLPHFGLHHTRPPIKITSFPNGETLCFGVKYVPFTEREQIEQKWLLSCVEKIDFFYYKSLIAQTTRYMY